MRSGWLKIVLVVAVLGLSPVGASGATQVLITVDVESYTNGDPERQVWGRFSGEEHGITRIMDLLEARDFKGTFFVTPYEAAKHGENAMRDAARAIHSRGHDLQLHTHPGPMYGVKRLSHADLPHQVEILRQGMEMLKRWTGKSVIAHRAGAYAANLDTLEACRQVGLVLDASFSPAARHTQLARQVLKTNQPLEMNGVLELPVTYYIQAGIGGWRSMRIVDIEASTLRELRSIVRQARDQGLPMVNVMMHSFSFVRYGRVSHDVEQRFADFLEFLEREPGIAVVTVADFYRDWQSNGVQRAAIENVEPYTGWWLTYLRAVEDIDKGYRNIVVAFAPPAVLLLFGLAGIWWRRRALVRKA